jgi:hypothetical protein
MDAEDFRTGNERLGIPGESPRTPAEDLRTSG